MANFKAAARTENPCKVCGIFVEAGEMFVWSRRLRGVTYHQACFDSFKPVETVNEKGEVEITSQAVKAEIKSDFLKHEKFDLLLSLCLAHSQATPINVWLTGPAGSGKTKACEQIAAAMDQPFYFIGAISEPYSLLGYRDATGNYVRTLFREAYENGGVFLMDEIDGSSPNALLVFNAALANGFCAFPDKVVPRHKDCIVIAAANTFGLGGTSDYVGRVKLDAATLSRFVWIDWQYDERLERKLAGNDKWFERVLNIRTKAKNLGLKILITPRATYTGAALLKAGIAWETVELLVVKQGMTDEQWGSIK